MDNDYKMTQDFIIYLILLPVSVGYKEILASYRNYYTITANHAYDRQETLTKCRRTIKLSRTSIHPISSFIHGPKTTLINYVPDQTVTAMVTFVFLITFSLCPQSFIV